MKNKVKNEAFFESFSKVKDLNVKAYDKIRSEIGEGNTEKELYDKVVETYLSLAQGDLKYEGDFISGKRTCEIEGPATDKTIEKGDTVIVDALVSLNGIHCDTTRTFFCGEPGEEQVKVYTFLCDLLEQLRALLKPDVKVCEIYNFADRKIKEAGFGGLVHHAGHSLGYEWCEEPRFIAESDQVLKENMLVTLEPGIYLENKFGIRIENNYRVTKDGGVDLFGYTTDINDFVLRKS